MNNIWYLEQINLFKTLCPHKVKEYKKVHNFKSYEKSDYVYFSDDEANKIYLIASGKVKIGYYLEDGTEVIKAILGKGEIFGEKAILGEQTRDEFAQSLDKSTSICPVNTSIIHDLMRDNKTLTLSIYKIINFRLKKMERRLELLLFKDAQERVLGFLEDLKTDYSNQTSSEGNIIIEHPFTQKEIATLIGLSRPTLNILLKKLRDDKILEYNRKTIVFLRKC